MHSTASIEAKDLLNRMLQPNPFKRITIPEIKDHPWFKTDDRQKDFKVENDEGVDQEIVEKLFDLKLGLNHKDRPKIEEAISHGEKYDFWIAYEYLKHSKMLDNFNSMNLNTSNKQVVKFDKTLLSK